MVWELVRFTGMSKNQVLEEIYPDEVPDLLKKANIERPAATERTDWIFLYSYGAGAAVDEGRGWISKRFDQALPGN